jgi:hypothetical protein
MLVAFIWSVPPDNLRESLLNEIWSDVASEHLRDSLVPLKRIVGWVLLEMPLDLIGVLLCEVLAMHKTRLSVFDRLLIYALQQKLIFVLEY